MKLFIVLFETKTGLLQRERQTKLNYQLNFSQIGHKVFEKLPLKDCLYFIVFANILIKLMLLLSYRIVV